MRKVVRVSSGLILILVGFILSLPLVPGPGVAVMAVGLVMISEDFPWAKRIVDWGKEKWHQLLARLGSGKGPGGTRAGAAPDRGAADPNTSPKP
jgi:hypothetical protein